jgi:Rps23 Pro-64 3,4-dihydroxylase Tpa1-like proline 4-hydroxylase
MPFRLAGGLDRRTLTKEYGATGRLQIPGFLPAETATEVERCLREDVAWNLTLNSGENVFDLSPSALEVMGPAKRAELHASVHERARDGYQYLYETHRMNFAGEAYQGRHETLRRLTEFLNGPEFLAFAREILSEPFIAFADVRAARYGPGHFLNTHTDLDQTKKRFAAYVLNFTRDWRPEWGGYLKFIDAGGHISGGLMPAFNALNLFRVPQPHFVAAVSLEAPAPRYTITGWLRGR